MKAVHHNGRRSKCNMKIYQQHANTYLNNFIILCQLSVQPFNAATKKKHIRASMSRAIQQCQLLPWHRKASRKHYPAPDAFATGTRLPPAEVKASRIVKAN